MTRLDIQLDDLKGFYYPGENLSGELLVTSDRTETEQQQEVSFELLGISSANWTRNSGDQEKSCKYYKEHFSSQRLFSVPTARTEELNLPNFGLENESFMARMYNFCFDLPSDLPPSVEADLGYVRYEIRARLIFKSDRSDSVPGIYVEETVPVKIVVLPVFGFRRRKLLEPVVARTQISVCCFRFSTCCFIGHAIKLPKRVYDVGEQLAFSFLIYNQREIDIIKRIEGRLISKFTFMDAGGNKTVTENTVASVRLNEETLEIGMNHLNGELTIPTNVTASFDNCKCIHLEYYFLQYVATDSTVDEDVQIPIVISSGPRIEEQLRLPDDPNLMNEVEIDIVNPSSKPQHEFELKKTSPVSMQSLSSKAYDNIAMSVEDCLNRPSTSKDYRD